MKPAQQSVPPRFLVVAGKYGDYEEFLRTTHIPRKHTEPVIRWGQLSCYGRHPRFHVVYCGEYWTNEVLDDARALLSLLVLGLEDHEPGLSQETLDAFFALFPDDESLGDKSDQHQPEDRRLVGTETDA